MYSKKNFLLAARERLQKSGGTKRFVYTKHSEYKMREYSLSRQKVEGIIRRPYRTETGIVPRTVAVMQPVSPKTVEGRTTWKQEIWTLYQSRQGGTISKSQFLPPQRDPAKAVAISNEIPNPKFQIQNSSQQLLIISAWRYPGVSPAGNPIPANILRELEEGNILEEEIETYQL
jgi:hypothetical protein